ncbi:uncharacterized protein M421DRAFT_421469 [Didymella exigua CBS 183.55]|uniref:Uncharacterized protein n=1 Tax=Didymella exigua CBS 183.55 TaxID=1150837 RepID=A0A6A5RKX2_9PLEO|nr:uncharacterized protein M421DRAFT_421469 [Didymella exigua CBS 183.55]KAF1927624.1 hypothetical protein M421DRAFT_421469 [Didymella exigua CBS 183.55]
MDLYILADKYGMRSFIDATTNHLDTLLHDSEDVAILKAAIHHHYNSGPETNSMLGKHITSALVEPNWKHLTSDYFETTAISFKSFATDFALALERSGHLELDDVKCANWDSGHINWVDIHQVRSMGNNGVHCNLCGTAIDILKSQMISAFAGRLRA